MLKENVLRLKYPHPHPHPSPAPEYLPAHDK